MKKKLSLLLALVMMLTTVFASFPVAAEEKAAPKKHEIIVLHTNDVHARVRADEREKAMGYLKLLKRKIQVILQLSNTRNISWQQEKLPSQF